MAILDIYVYISCGNLTTPCNNTMLTLIHLHLAYLEALFYQPVWDGKKPCLVVEVETYFTDEGTKTKGSLQTITSFFKVSFSSPKWRSLKTWKGHERHTQRGHNQKNLVCENDHLKLEPRCSMYGLFTYIRRNMATFKGKWLGKYSRHMEHLGNKDPKKNLLLLTLLGNQSCSNPRSWYWMRGTFLRHIPRTKYHQTFQVPKLTNMFRYLNGGTEPDKAILGGGYSLT